GYPLADDVVPGLAAGVGRYPARGDPGVIAGHRIPYATLCRSLIPRFNQRNPQAASAANRFRKQGKSQLLQSRRKRLPPCTPHALDRKSTRLNSSHVKISYAVFCLKKKKRGRGTCSDVLDDAS